MELCSVGMVFYKHRAPEGAQKLIKILLPAVALRARIQSDQTHGGANMKSTLMVLVTTTSLAFILWFYAGANHHVVQARSGIGPLYSAREKIVLNRDAATGKVTGMLEKGTIAVAYVNLW